MMRTKTVAVSFMAVALLGGCASLPPLAPTMRNSLGEAKRLEAIGYVAVDAVHLSSTKTTQPAAAKVLDDEARNEAIIAACDAAYATGIAKLVGKVIGTTAKWEVNTVNVRYASGRSEAKTDERIKDFSLEFRQPVRGNGCVVVVAIRPDKISAVKSIIQANIDWFFRMPSDATK